MSEAKTGKQFQFEQLVAAVVKIHSESSTYAKKAVNLGLTLRNWTIGCYIAEYELHGEDRAQYGEKLLSSLANELAGKKISNCNRRQLYRYLRFYRTFPAIVGALSPQFAGLLPDSVASRKVGTLSPQSIDSIKPILEKLSYSHIEQLVDLDDEAKRAFYFTHCVQGSWSVRELKRQISSLYFERTGLSTNPQALTDETNQRAEREPASLIIRDPYVFEFLGLKAKEVMSESDLEGQLLDKIEEFLLELGHGFCFEARQKRILIGDKHGFIDLVFYHRILKCHVLIDLKLEEFTHENIGQLNTYVSWYRKNVMVEGDNPPVGILLCTQKDHTLAEYALAGMDNQLFVSKYQLELPTKDELQAFVDQQHGQLK